VSRFHAFSYHDLELLVADLLGTDEHARYEVFARGPDAGIDLRRVDEGGRLHIVQVKHYERSSFSTLETQAKAEKKKLDDLDRRPDRYRFVTSRELTVDNKKKLRAALAPYISAEQDIIGGTELDQLVRVHSEVERRHPKLWLTGSTQLVDMVHSDVRNRSRALIAQVEEDLPLYVRHQRFDEARERLHEGRVVVIAGDAGVGKTTLAHLLLADALRNGGYEPVEVLRNIEEGWKVCDDFSRRQVVLYDDFLGRAALSRLDKNEDKSLVAFMRAVLRSQQTLFILTTREYILQHAAQLHEELQYGGVPERRYVLRLRDYSLLDKAHIFINHAYQARTLPAAAREALLVDDAYRRILEHPNYNPRTIAYVTGIGGPRLDDEALADYAGYVLSVLDDSARLWRKTFREEIADGDRALLLALATGPDELQLADLRRMFDALTRELRHGGGEEAFEDALRRLDDSLIRTYHEQEMVFVAPRDPAVGDYLTTHIAGTPEDARALLRSAVAFEQLFWLVRNADVDRMDDTLEDVADAAVRTYEAESITWKPVYWNRDPEPVLTRDRRDEAERLLAVHRLMQRSRRLQERLGEWWSSRLGTFIKSLPDQQPELREVMQLVQTVKGQLRAVDGAGAALASVFTSRLSYPYAWEQLLRFRELWPDAFTDAEWERLIDRFESWALSELGNAEELQDVEEVEDIASIARRLDVDLPAPLVDHATAVAEEEHGSRDDVRDYEPPEEPPEALAPTDEERAQVRGMFVELAEEPTD
jgi:hypothetical protein